MSGNIVESVCSNDVNIDQTGVELFLSVGIL